MSPTAEPRILALRCPACRTELPAAANDLAFLCPKCGRAWEIIDHAFKERRSLHVTPPAGPALDTLYLPYWSFPISASAERTGWADMGSLSARDRAAAMRRGFVAAYSIFRPTYIGEWGLVYTRVQPDWETRSGGGTQAPGAAISAEDARAIVKHYILGEIDRAADLGSLDVNVELGEPELWAIPCFDLGVKIRCPWSRGELPTAMLDDIAEIRRSSERREA